MATLLIKTAGLDNRLLDLKLGVNRVGRGADNDFRVAHHSVSGRHCELTLADGGVTICDLDSTNGTFVDGRRITKARLSPGQTVHIGHVELLVESTDVTIAIPKFIDPELPAPPVVARNGSILCPQHPRVPVSHRCTHCGEVMCDACVRRLRRQGAKNLLRLCPFCSHAVERIGNGPTPGKKTFFAKVAETVKLKFMRILQGRRAG